VLRLTTIEQGPSTPLRAGPSTPLRAGDTGDRRGSLRAGFVSIACLLRSLPLFFSAAPATPLRVLCIVALDTIHVLRYSQPLSRPRREELARFLDFQACTNAVWDRKPLCSVEYQALRQQLEQAGLGTWITEYLNRVGDLETRRPPAGGSRRRFDEVRSYREGVARLSLATIAAIALNAECLDDAIRSTYRESDLAALFRMAMQCQIIDDVVDYDEDLSSDLPSFLTASVSLPQAIVLTADAARSYGARSRRSAGGGVFLLEAALYVLTAVTLLVVAVAGRGEVRSELAGD
jgi:hypothetical protein